MRKGKEEGSDIHIDILGEQKIVDSVNEKLKENCKPLGHPRAPREKSAKRLRMRLRLRKDFLNLNLNPCYCRGRLLNSSFLVFLVSLIFIRAGFVVHNLFGLNFAQIQV